MNDLNDLFYFAKIVEHGSLSAASAELGVAKSVLSEHLSRLEANLGVRLLQRNTRKLQITDVGSRYYQRCRAVLLEVERANSVIDDARGTPRGVVRVTSPVNFAQTILAPLLVDFMLGYPEVEVVLDMTNREVDVIADGYDVALRIAPGIRASSLAVRSFVLRRHLLVASPSWIERHGLPRRPEDLRGAAGLGGLLDLGRGNRHGWRLVGPGGDIHEIAFAPRLITEDIVVIMQAALGGCGVAELPVSMCRAEIADGRLVVLLPEWSLPEMTLYAVFASRKGLAPAVRCFIDYLSEHLHGALDQAFSTQRPTTLA
ncbi:LysR substrate-binding domain-containing protein [Dokdonella sp.]|uniref:LysR substrate-binding domain-containing protein n=1 Tax=Dokdonella sp. TaxID=2291710 RepID=UPI00260767A2|nr:LysR substrate-binding domain-containing protein [Dokdonella sp.]